MQSGREFKGWGGGGKRSTVCVYLRPQGPLRPAEDLRMYSRHHWASSSTGLDGTFSFLPFEEANGDRQKDKKSQQEPVGLGSKEPAVTPAIG